MSTTAMAARHLHAPASDPYRVLFDHLSAGAAWCRLIVDGDRVVDVELVDSNAAFQPLRGSLPQLYGMFSQVRELGRPATAQVRTEGAVLAASAYPVGRDEVMVVIEDVTARERLEQRSRESQDRFEQAFHGNAAAMVIAHRNDLRIVDVNPRWLEMFGATRDEVIGRTAVELGVITESGARSRIAEHQQFADGHEAELELRTRTGASVTVLASAKPIEIAEGRCTLTTLIDITARKHAEEAFAVAFSASPAGMILVDTVSDTVVAVNNRLLEMTRDRREDLVGRRTGELRLVVDPPREVLLAEIERSGRLNGVEVELACEGGPGVSALASTETIMLHDRVHRLTVFTDITTRKRSENRLLTQLRVGRRLAEASELDAAIPHVLEALCRGEGWDCGAVWLPGVEQGVLQCCGTWRDPRLASELGAPTRVIERSSDSLLGRVLATGVAEKVVLDPATGAHGVAAAAAGMRCAVAFPVLRGSAVLGVVAMAARGGDHALDTAERALLDSVGRLLGLFIERARAEASLRELNVELERRVLERTHELETSNRDLEAFSSSVSHDLRAPLRAIHGFSEMLLEDFAGELSTEARDLVARIHAGGGRLRKLVDELLAFARLGRDGLRLGHVELDPLVRAVCDELLVGRELGGRLELRATPLGSCRADASLLRTVWTNLIDNALKYARTRERIKIEIGRDDRCGEVVYFVRDNGIGFDMAHADRLFGVFQRLHAGSEFEGTGVGLANVRRIVERHNGRVGATSELGRGSRFEFTLGTEVK
jgi:PAS domain S-box-containing protein